MRWFRWRRKMEKDLYQGWRRCWFEFRWWRRCRILEVFSSSETCSGVNKSDVPAAVALGGVVALSIMGGFYSNKMWELVVNRFCGF